MKKNTSVHILLLYSMFLAGYLDLCMGLALTQAVSYYLKMPVTLAHYLLGAMLAMLPDFDLLFSYFVKKQTQGNHHEMLTHRPLFMLPIVTLLAYKFGGVFWVLLSGSCLLWHFIHDTEGLGGGGIAWLWPASKKYYSFSGSKDPADSIAAGVLDFHKWLKDYWLWPSKQSLIETALGSALLGMVLYLNFGLLGALLGAALVPIITILMWKWHRRLGV